MDEHEHNNDGKHDGYLKRGSASSRNSFRDCDPELYDRMQMIRQGENLDVAQVQDGSAFAKNTLFFGTPVPVFQGPLPRSSDREQRRDEREQWHRDAMSTVEQAGVVFTDPDNGIVFSSRDELGLRKPSHKHSYWYELGDYLERGQSVIAYHHLGRQSGGHQQQIENCLRWVREIGYEAWAIHYRRGTSRAFLVIPTSVARDRYLDVSHRFAARWSEHASIVLCPD